MLALFRRTRFYLASALLLVCGSLHLLIAETEPQACRVLSDHANSQPYVNKRQVARVPIEVLEQLVGHYVGPRSGDMHIQRDGETLLLLLNNGKFDYVLYPESETLFFRKDRDFTFEFVKNAKHQVTKLILRERGMIVETARAAR